MLSPRFATLTNWRKGRPIFMLALKNGEMNWFHTY